MEILEFGDRNKRKIIFIHGFQCPYQIWEKYIEHYQKDYHIIIPIMPGHNPKKQEKFFSFLQTSRELEDYYLWNVNGWCFDRYVMAKWTIRN